MNSYQSLKKQNFYSNDFSLVPIRFEDRFDILKWRNEQIYHLRQNVKLTIENQNIYFENVVSKLFFQNKPNQILFSFLKEGICIGYGGLVHINWIDKHAEISFVMNTSLEVDFFQKYWEIYLGLIEQVAFDQLNFHKIFTYAFDLRPKLYLALENVGFKKEATLKDHCLFNNEYINVILHSKFSKERFELVPAKLSDTELLFNWANDSTVRNNSFNPNKILWEDHEKWFKHKIESLESKIFILKCNSISVGQIRLDFNGEAWEIDYSIDLAYRGNGYGNRIINLIFEEFNKGDKLIAKVKDENNASLKVFNKLCFKVNQKESDNITVFIKTIE